MDTKLKIIWLMGLIILAFLLVWGWTGYSKMKQNYYNLGVNDGTNLIFQQIQTSLRTTQDLIVPYITKTNESVKVRLIPEGACPK